MRTRFYKDWQMTVAQHGEYFSLWGQVLALHPEWDAREADAQRLAAHTRAFGYPKSRKEIGHKQDFTKIKLEFMALLHPAQLEPVLKQVTMPERNLRHKVLVDFVKLLTVALAPVSWRDNGSTISPGVPASGVAGDIESAQRYVARVMRERFGTEDIHSISDQRPHPDAYSELEKLVFTLERCVSEQRQKHIPPGLKGADVGWMVHDLRMAAGVSCDCAGCKRKRTSTSTQSMKREEVMA